MGSHIVFLNNVFYNEQNVITVYIFENKVELNNLVNNSCSIMFILKQINLEANSWNVLNFL